MYVESVQFKLMASVAYVRTYVQVPYTQVAQMSMASLILTILSIFILYLWHTIFPMGRNVHSEIHFMYITEDSLWGHERPRYGSLHYLACSRAAIGTVDTCLIGI